MRLKDEALCVKINSLNISEVTEKSIDEAQSGLKVYKMFYLKERTKLHNIY